MNNDTLDHDSSISRKDSFRNTFQPKDTVRQIERDELYLKRFLSESIHEILESWPRVSYVLNNWKSSWDVKDPYRKCKGIIAEIDAKRRSSNAERGSAFHVRNAVLQEKPIAIPQNGMLATKRAVYLKEINPLKKLLCFSGWFWERKRESMFILQEDTRI